MQPSCSAMPALLDPAARRAARGAPRPGGGRAGQGGVGPSAARSRGARVDRPCRPHPDARADRPACARHGDAARPERAGGAAGCAGDDARACRSWRRCCAAASPPCATPVAPASGSSARWPKALVAGPRLFVSGHALSQTGGHGDTRARSDFLRPVGACGCFRAGALSRVVDGVDARAPGGARGTPDGRRPDQDHGLGRHRLAHRSDRGLGLRRRRDPRRSSHEADARGRPTSWRTPTRPRRSSAWSAWACAPSSTATWSTSGWRR